MKFDPRDIAIRRSEMPELHSNVTIDWSKLQALPGVPDWTQQRDGVVKDSAMKFHEAFQNLPLNCPDEILARQQVIRTLSWGIDGRLHEGQAVIDQELVRDLQDAFAFMREIRFPVQSVIPVSADRFSTDSSDKYLMKKGPWDDDRSMDVGNSSGFNFREIYDGAGFKTGRLSLHALGLAFDINPHLNPFFKEREGKDPKDNPWFDEMRKAGVGDPARYYELLVPVGSAYDISVEGTLYARHPVVEFFKDRGWTWGGDWTVGRVDLHHFEKIPHSSKDFVAKYRS